MKVNLGTIEVHDDLRRAINARHGQPGLATRKDVRDTCLGHLHADLEAIQDDYDQEQKQKREKETEG